MAIPCQPGPEGKEKELSQKPVPQPGEKSCVERPPDKMRDERPVVEGHSQPPAVSPEEARAITLTPCCCPLPRFPSGASHWPNPNRAREHVGIEPAGSPPGHRAPRRAEGSKIFSTCGKNVGQYKSKTNSEESGSLHT